MDAFTHAALIAAYDRAIEVAEVARAEARTTNAAAQAAVRESRNAEMRASDLIGEALLAYRYLRRYEADAQLLVNRQDLQVVTG